MGLVLVLDLLGTEGYNFPYLTVTINDIIYYDDYVVGHRIIELSPNDADIYHVNISGIGKKFGENNIWDTVVDDKGTIIKDNTLIFNDILINSISMGKIWLRKQKTKLDSTHTTFEYCGFFSNGSLYFTIEKPILDFIIHEKFIKNQLENNSGIWEGNDKFDHISVINKINQIEMKYFNDQNFDM